MKKRGRRKSGIVLERQRIPPHAPRRGDSSPLPDGRRKDAGDGAVNLGLFQNLVVIIAHEAGHAVAAWASPFCSALDAIRFHPEKGEATCEILACPDPISIEDCIELSTYFLGGIAGETVAYGGFEELGGTDLRQSLKMTAIIRGTAVRPRRVHLRPNAFLAKLPKEIFSEHRAWMNRAYDLAVDRIKTHQEAHRRLRDLLTQGYIKGQLEWRSAELAECLGPRPF